MKESVAEGLRQLWRELGNLPCVHSDLEREIGFAGTSTGNRVCSSCGAQFPIIEPSANHGRL
ncbi:hypothetical protein [Candidatus Nitrospira bockiana]